MSFGTSTDEDEVMNEINMTPLVDVMLVLLIIFIITVPVMKHAIKLDLPQASSQKQDPKPAAIRLSIDAQGTYYLNEVKVSDEQLAQQLQSAAGQTPQPELHIQGDKAVRYERVAVAMASAKRAGVGKVGFVTEPK